MITQYIKHACNYNSYYHHRRMRLENITNDIEVPGSRVSDW